MSDCPVVSGFDVPRGKPHPDIFLHTCEMLGAVDPPRVVVIEDAGTFPALSAVGLVPVVIRVVYLLGHLWCTCAINHNSHRSTRCLGGTMYCGRCGIYFFKSSA